LIEAGIWPPHLPDRGQFQPRSFLVNKGFDQFTNTIFQLVRLDNFSLNDTESWIAVVINPSYLDVATIKKLQFIKSLTHAASLKSQYKLSLAFLQLAIDASITSNHVVARVLHLLFGFEYTIQLAVFWLEVV
jgi:hypothetical protein